MRGVKRQKAAAAGSSAPLARRSPHAPCAHSGGADKSGGDSLSGTVLSFLAGGVAGAVAKSVIAPLDRLKIIFQISNMAFSYRGLWNELARTAREDGVRALFRGNVAQVLRVYPYSGVQLMSFDKFSLWLLRRRGKGGDGGARLTGAEKLLAGSAAGATSVAATYPLDLMRARLAVVQTAREAAAAAAAAHHGAAPHLHAVDGAHNNPHLPRVEYRGIAHAFSDMHARHGLASFYRGMAPTLLGILPYAGLAFYTFETLKQAYADAHGGAAPGSAAKLLFGGAAGLVGQTCTYPFDIVRRRMQTEGFSAIHAHHESASAGAGAGRHMGHPPEARPAAASAASAASPAAAAVAADASGGSEWWRRRRGGMLDTGARIVAREGAAGLFKGLSLNFVKGPVAAGVSFTMYDVMKRKLGVVKAGGGGGGG